MLAVFNRDGLHIQKRDLDGADPFRHVPGWTAPVAKVVGASSAFPGFFPPVEISAADLGVRDGHFPTESFTDGGVYDNLGLRAFRWLQHRGRRLDHVIVSDAGKPFQILGESTLGFVAQSIRATDILWDRVWQLERENFGAAGTFHFVPAASIVPREEDPRSLHPVIQAEVASIRTDLDRFSDLEVGALVAHGYEVARSVHRRLADAALPPVHEGPVWLPLGGGSALLDDQPAAPGTARAAGTSPTAGVAAKLRRSGRRRVWSTLFDPYDWPSWIYLALALLLFVWLPLRFWRLHHHERMLTSVIDSIAKGDPDIRLVLDLVENDPLGSWTPVPATPTEELPPVRIEGIDILSRSRIVDLRTAWKATGGRQGSGLVQLRDRLTVRVREGAVAPALTLRTWSTVTELEYRQPRKQPQVSVLRGEVEVDGRPQTRYSLSCDLSAAPRGVPVTVEVATKVRYASMPEGRMPFLLDHPTDLLTVWMLFPEDHPYRTYRLERHPVADPTAVEPLESRYTIDHPYGTLIGWSVITPDPQTVYECRWTTE